MDAPENEQVHELVAAWFRALDRHASIDECASMLAIRNLRMHFPDADVHDTDQFREWYERVCRTYFDEQHTTQKVVIESAANDEVRVTVVVRWQASTRDVARGNAPAARQGGDPKMEPSEVNKKFLWLGNRGL